MHLAANVEMHEKSHQTLIIHTHTHAVVQTGDAAGLKLQLYSSLITAQALARNLTRPRVRVLLPHL